MKARLLPQGSGAAPPHGSSPLLRPAAILGWRSSRFQSISPPGTSCRYARRHEPSFLIKLPVQPVGSFRPCLNQQVRSDWKTPARARTSSRDASRNYLLCTAGGEQFCVNASRRLVFGVNTMIIEIQPFRIHGKEFKRNRFTH